MNRLSSNFVNDSVIDNSTYFPSLSIFLTNLRSYPKEDQESAITDPVTLSLITNPVYCLGRLWERSSISRLISDSVSEGSSFFKHPYTRQNVSINISPVDAPSALAVIADILNNPHVPLEKFPVPMISSSLKNRIIDKVSSQRVTIVVGPTGCGKSTTGKLDYFLVSSILYVCYIKSGFSFTKITAPFVVASLL